MSPAPDLRLDLSLTRENFQLNVKAVLPRQGVTVLFGPSGSGKTTLLRCLAGLERAQGRVAIDQDIWQDSAQNIWVPTFRRDLGYVFQEASLFEHLNVRANLRFGIDRVTKPGSEAALNSAITLLGIGHLLDRNTQSLSGGERQRVAIARALATQPKILLLDEPLASLDIGRRQEILPWLETMHHDLHIPIIYVTHSMEELIRLADHVVLLDHGQVKAQGPISTVLSDPIFASTAGGEAGAVLTGTIQSHDMIHHLTCIDLDGACLWVRHQDLAPGSRVRIHIHANDVSLAIHEPIGSSIQNVLPGVIAAIHQDTHPANCLVTLRHHDQSLIARITCKALTALSLSVGTRVWMQIKSVALANPHALLAPSARNPLINAVISSALNRK